jgi:hypothetical protein
MMTGMLARLLNWLFGPPIWVVVDDGSTGRPKWDIYPCVIARADASDRVIATGLRYREARRIARAAISRATGAADE